MNSLMYRKVACSSICAGRNSKARNREPAVVVRIGKEMTRAKIQSTPSSERRENIFLYAFGASVREKFLEVITSNIFKRNNLSGLKILQGNRVFLTIVINLR